MTESSETLGHGLSRQTEFHLKRIGAKGFIRTADMALDEAEWSMKQKMRQTTRAQDRMKQAEHDTR